MPAAARPPLRRRLSAEERRASILDAAIPLFASAGYEQTRMADVAERVGVTEPVIFQNFGTKAELFAAALEHASRQGADYLKSQSLKHGSVRLWVSGLLSTEHLDHLHTAPMFGVLFADAHRLQLEPGVSAALQRSVARVAEALAEIMHRGQLEGSIRTDEPPHTLAWLVLSLIQAREFRRTYTPEPSIILENELRQRLVALLAARSRYPVRHSRRR